MVRLFMFVVFQILYSSVSLSRPGLKILLDIFLSKIESLLCSNVFNAHVNKLLLVIGTTGYGITEPKNGECGSSSKSIGYFAGSCNLMLPLVWRHT